MTTRRSRVDSPPRRSGPDGAVRAGGEAGRQGPSTDADRVARSAPQEVRLIGGRFKRSPLNVPTWPGLRPTSSRVRETLFNWLGQDLSGWRVLDAFAGSGALGLEAASRGAAGVVMLEKEVSLARGIQANVRRLGAEGVTVLAVDAIGWMKQQAARQPNAFDLVLLDPPFGDGLFEEALRTAMACVPLGGWLYLEAPMPCANPGAEDAHSVPGAQSLVLPAGLRLHRQGKAGAVHYHLIERVDSLPNALGPGG